MKKLLSMVLCFAVALSCAAVFTGCKKEAKTYEIAVVTDVGQLKDGGFNQGTYEGAEAYAKAHNKTYKYYQPANGSDATDNDRIAAMRQAVKNGAKIIVAPGYLQATAMTTVALESPNVKFVFIDGWTLTDKKGEAIPNVTAVVYKEQESGYLAGYAVVKEGYTKLGATLGGGGSNPACNRFGYGFVQGAEAAAVEMNKSVEIKYNDGTQVVFACGGSMFQSVKSAAEENSTKEPKIVGVDVDQSSLSEYVITSAVKGLKESVQIILGEYYDGQWDSKLGGKTSNLGASDNATGLPETTWKMQNFTLEQYKALFAKVAGGQVTIDSNVDGISDTKNWFAAKSFTKVTVVVEA